MGSFSFRNDHWRERAEIRRRGFQVLATANGALFVFEGDPSDGPPIGQIWLTPLGWCYVALARDRKLHEKPIGPFPRIARAVLDLDEYRTEALERAGVPEEGAPVVPLFHGAAADSDDPGSTPYRFPIDPASA
jgi:hypothetical protein